MSFDTDKMTRTEKRVALSLAAIFISRMLGLFMILPVFAVYAKQLEGFTPTLAGVAIGIYGLTQALFQIPLGSLSDRIGRKPVIIGGLLVFALGSVVAAESVTVHGVIIGRALQGAGAIASAVMALAADLTREEHRIKVMATIGMSIGLSFAVAMVIGPVFHGWFGVSGIFWITALLALGGITVAKLWVPSPVRSRFHRDTEVDVHWLWQALSDRQLLRLDIGVLILHLMLVSMFMVVPGLLEEQLGLDVHHHWQLYLPVLFFAVLAMVPFIIIAEKKRKIKQVVTGAVVVLAISQLLLPMLRDTMVGMVFVLWLFFTAFNLLEASMPSLVAKLAPAAHKGTAMGAYSTSQFLGVFLGGLSGGWLSQHFGLSGVAAFNVLLALCWAALALSMRKPQYHSSYLLNIGQVTEQKAQELVEALSAVNGVVEATVVAEDGIAYLKVDKNRLDMDTLHSYAVSA